MPDSIRLWLLIQGEQGRKSVLLTGAEMVRHNVHPLRCLYLGRFAAEDDPTALAKARELATQTTQGNVSARNVRVACDSGQTRRWRLSADELAVLRRGEILRIRDGVGEFAVMYTRFKND